MSADPVLDTLLLPFRENYLSWPQDATLFLRARDGSALRDIDRSLLHCEQTFKPDTDALLRAGFALNGGTQKYSMILVLPPRQRDEARALFARALTHLNSGGQIVASASNNEGARSHETDLEKLAGPLATLSKNKCRVFWTAPKANFNTTLANDWRELDSPRPICDGRFLSRPGVFAWDHIDFASALLAKHLPNDLAGRAADLGAGFGYLSAELLARCPNIISLDLYEAEQRALDLARVNLNDARVLLEFFWHDVTTGLPRKYDVVVTNPPFHTQSRIERPNIGRAFIAAAAKSLRPGGRLWLVANRHLPYESVLDDSFAKVRLVEQEHGFKIIEAVKSAV